MSKPKRNTSNEYSGPSVKDMIASHTLAKEIIARHDDACPIFDDESILRLRRFVREPAAAQSLLREFDMQDEEGEEVGAGARHKGSLTGHIMATWGTEKSALTEDEVRALREWFDNGGGRTDAELEEKAAAS